MLISLEYLVIFLFVFCFYLFLEIDIMCWLDYIEVIFKFVDYLGFVVNDFVLYFEDMKCVVGYKDDEMVKFMFGLEECKIM